MNKYIEDLIAICTKEKFIIEEVHIDPQVDSDFLGYAIVIDPLGNFITLDLKKAKKYECYKYSWVAVKANKIY